MKNITGTIICIFFFFFSNGQDVKEYLLNRYFEVTTDEKEAFFVRLTKPYNNYIAYTDYDGKQRIVQTGFFTDTTFTVPIGPHKFYWEGVKLYEGIYVNGKPSGYWYFFDKKGAVTDSLHYVVIEPKVENLPGTDTAKMNSSSTNLRNEHLKKDITNPFANVEKEAEFKGGLNAWQKHLIKNIEFPDLVMNTKRQQKSTVVIQFIVCSDGEVCSVEALNSFHPLLDLIAVNAIRKGPKWTPAYQSGRNVKAYRRQPITFVVPD